MEKAAPQKNSLLQDPHAATEKTNPFTAYSAMQDQHRDNSRHHTGRSSRLRMLQVKRDRWTQSDEEEEEEVGLVREVTTKREKKDKRMKKLRLG
ncbi:hypothetical protein F2P81_000873 [Scophthalmus maximus]|uniref:Uncharacterized protein n=1 Tax=Scophthalmus maximus TaxID=52904 RepID=A0A6A4TUB8_SCOMX|nr:hypothetical protein F2P81_000873 [Scophthalmus maximus]